MTHVGPEERQQPCQGQAQGQKTTPRNGRAAAGQRADPVQNGRGKAHASDRRAVGGRSDGAERKLWTTRDLQEAAAAGALVEAFESDEDFVSEDFFSDGFESEEDVVDAALLDEPDRLSVR